MTKKYGSIAAPAGLKLVSTPISEKEKALPDAAKHSLFRSDARDVFNVSYVGQTDWGGMDEYISEIHTITDGDFMLEVNALKQRKDHPG